MKKITAVLLSVILTVSLLSACACAHKCSHVCPDCGKCQDANCTYDECMQKCQCNVAHVCHSKCAVCGKCNSNCLDDVCSDKCKCGAVHTCGHRCAVCGGCTDFNCNNPQCAEKCNCNEKHKCLSKCGICGKCTNAACSDETCSVKCDGCVNVNGNIITFGKWEQDGNDANGKEAIEWIVLYQDAEQILVVSKYVLDYVSYAGQDDSTTWRTASLRTFLADDFYKNAFSQCEKNRIARVKNVNPDNEIYRIDGGRDTTDSVFVLSYVEAEQYLAGALSAASTAYAQSKGASAQCNYWLRTPGNAANKAMVVSYDGRFNTVGLRVDLANCGVRPAMWIVK